MCDACPDFDGVEQSSEPNLIEDTMLLAAKIVRVLQDYDLGKITPNNTIKMAGRLFNEGAIRDDEYRVLAYCIYDPDDQLLLSSTYRKMMENRNTAIDLTGQYEAICNELMEYSVCETLTVCRRVLIMLHAFQEGTMPDNEQV